MSAVKLQDGQAATRAKESRGRASYERDYYSWTIQQAAALREGQIAALDLENLAEEIEDLGKEQFSKLESALRLILLHLSKWDRQPKRRTRSWVLTIERERYATVLGDNPGLKPRRVEALGRAYRLARIEAMDETGLPRTAFPEDCPYSLDEVLTRPIEWPEP